VKPAQSHLLYLFHRYCSGVIIFDRSFFAVIAESPPMQIPTDTPSSLPNFNAARAEKSHMQKFRPERYRSLHHKQMENITPSSANKACISGREAAQGMAAMLYARKSSLHKYYLSCPHSPFIGNSIQAHSPATTFTSYVSSWEYLDSFSWFALCL
jgi:hypothetical protein